MGAALIDGKPVYVGGEAAQPEASGDMQIFDPAANQWSVGPSLNQERHGTNCCVFNNTMWIAAGSGARRGEPELTCIESCPFEL